METKMWVCNMCDGLVARPLILPPIVKSGWFHDKWHTCMTCWFVMFVIPNGHMQRLKSSNEYGDYIYGNAKICHSSVMIPEIDS